VTPVAIIFSVSEIIADGSGGSRFTSSPRIHDLQIDEAGSEPRFFVAAALSDRAHSASSTMTSIAFPSCGFVR